MTDAGLLEAAAAGSHAGFAEIVSRHYQPVYRLVWRQILLFGHNIVIYVVIAMIYPKPWSWADLLAIPALFLIMLNCVWVSFCFGILSTRYRDIGPLLGSLVQLLFFMTPIIWNAETLQQQGAGRWSKIIELNPLLHYLDILRAPLLGAHQEPRHWIVVIVLTVLERSLAPMEPGHVSRNTWESADWGRPLPLARFASDGGALSFEALVASVNSETPPTAANRTYGEST